MLEFGEYKPDLPAILNDGLTRAEGVIPGEIGYLSIQKASDITTTPLDSRPQGIFSARDVTAVGTSYIYVGTSDKLYELSGNTWIDVSNGVYTIAADDQWEFAQWGNQLIATDFSDAVQVATIGGVFADLGGLPPKARHIAVVKDFVVLGNTYDAADGYQPLRVRWSGIGTNNVWDVTDPTTQAGVNDLFNNGGWIQRIIGGDYGIIFQERAIVKMSYIGSPVVFQFDLMESNRGAYAPGAVVAIGNNIAYLAEDGFFVFNGRESIPIGRGKVDRTFFDSTNQIGLNTLFKDRIVATSYPKEQIICWSYCSVSSFYEGVNDSILFYNYSPQAKSRWSILRTNIYDGTGLTTDIDHYFLASPLSQGYTLDGLDAVSTDLDHLPPLPAAEISLDSSFWTGQQRALGYIGTNLNLAFFQSGSVYDAILETGEFQLNPPNRTSITLIRPFISFAGGDLVGDIFIATSGRDNEYATASYSNTVNLNSSGFANVRNNSRFQRAYIKIIDGFSHAEGIDVIQSTKVGRR